MNNIVKLSDDEITTLQVGLLLSNQDMMTPERAEKVRNLIDRSMNYCKPDEAIREAALSIHALYLGVITPVGTKHPELALIERLQQLGRVGMG